MGLIRTVLVPNVWSAFSAALVTRDSGFLNAVAEGLSTDGTAGQLTLHYRNVW